MLDKYYHTKEAYYSNEKMVAYLKGELEDFEVRAFEKLLAEDPFLQDALEGVKLAGLAGAQKHLNQIEEKVDVITGVKKPMILSPNVRNISVAAMILVLIGASYIIIQQMDMAPESTQTAQEYAPDLENVKEEQPSKPVVTNTDDFESAANGEQEIPKVVVEEFDIVEEDVEAETLAAAAPPEMIDLEDEIELSEDAVNSDIVTYNYSAPTNTAMSKESMSEAFSGTPATQELATDTYFVVEEEPQFPGGQKALNEYLSNTIKYPAQAKDNKIEGIVYVSFVITETGDIVESKVVKGIGGGCDEEALRAVNEMPAWKPAKQGGVFVRMLYTLPVKFSMD